MIRKNFVLLALLAGGSLFGMEREVVKLKVDLLEKKYFDGVLKPGALLGLIWSLKNFEIDKPLLQELMRRGIPLELEDKDGDTALSLAAWSDRLNLCQTLIECGAKVGGPFKRQLLMCSLYPDHAVNDAMLYCGRLWFDRTRKHMLNAYLLSMKKLDIFPEEIQRRILSYCPEIIPSYCLDTVYSKEEAARILSLQNGEVEKLFAECKKWPNSK